MRLLLLLHLLLTALVLSSAAAQNGTKPTRKTLRMVKGLKKLSKVKSEKKLTKEAEQEKSESYHVPIILHPEAISREDIVPVSLELHDDARFLKASANLHPIEPAVFSADGNYQQERPLYVDGHEPPYSLDNYHSNEAYAGPVATPADYPPHGSEADGHYIHDTAIAPQEYYPNDYGDFSAIPGSPGVDYPTYSYLAATGFECLQHTATPGFYADVETKCQMWHYCQPDGRHDRFLCPNGTVFDQHTRVCNWWYNVHCDSSLQFYDINFDLYREAPKTSYPSQSLDAVPYHQSSSSHPASAESDLKPNSFLRHVKDFETGLENHPQHSGDYSSYGSDNYIRSLQSSVHPVQKYPSKTAPAPRVVHEYDATGAIDSDSSNSHTLATRVEEPAPVSELYQPKIQKKRIARRKLRKQPKIYSKNDDDDIPTYREGKVTPASRRYRVVRRRKVYKD